MSYQEIINNVADNLGLPYDVVKRTYESYWMFIRNHITELPLKDDLNEEDFRNLHTNFNIPSLGKLSCTYDRYKNIKDRFKYIRKLRDDSNNKEGKTHV